MAAGRGYNTQVAIGDEVAWGVEQPRTGLLLCTSVADDDNRPIITTPRIDGLYEEDTDEVLDIATGLPVFGLACRYGGAWLKILKHLFGGVTTSTPDPTTAPTARQHDFTLLEAALPGLSVEVYKENPGALTNAYLYTGCRVVSANFGFNMGSILTFGANLIGKSPADETKTTGLVASASKLVRPTESVITWNSGSVVAKSLSLQVNLGVAPQTGLGFATIGEPRKEQKTVVSGDIVCEFENADMYNDFKAATARQLLVTCTGPVIAGAFYNSLRLTMPFVRLRGKMPNVSGPGPVMQSIPFSAKVDVSNPLPLAIRVVNTDTSI